LPRVWSHAATGQGKIICCYPATHAASVDRQAQDITDDEEQIRQALHPLVHNRDGHFLATLSALILSLLESKTDSPISGVFGAGKTRAAAAIIAGLITVDPSLKMILRRKSCIPGLCKAHYKTLATQFD